MRVTEWMAWEGVFFLALPFSLCLLAANTWAVFFQQGLYHEISALETAENGLDLVKLCAKYTSILLNCQFGYVVLAMGK